MNLSRRSILNEFITSYYDTFVEAFKGEEYTVIVYCEVGYSDGINVFIDIDRLIVCWCGEGYL